MSIRKIFVSVIAVCILALSVSSCMAGAEEHIDVKISVSDVPMSNDKVLIRKDILFARYDAWPQADLKMDIYSPSDSGSDPGSDSGNAKHPAVILIPGGCWITAPKSAWSQMCMKLAENNFIAAGIEYRVIGAADYTEIIGDVKAAVRYLRAHADELHIDSNKIAVMGASAGGYLAVMLGVTGNTDKFTFGDNLNQSSKVQAVIDCFGLTDLTRTADDYSDEKKELYYSPSSFLSIFVNGVSGYKNRKGGSIRDNHDTAEDSNPLNYIGKDTPPFLIFHGDNDKTVSLSQSKILHDALTQKGIDSSFYIINGGEHDAVYFHQPEIVKIITDFLNRVLK